MTSASARMKTARSRKVSRKSRMRARTESLCVVDVRLNRVRRMSSSSVRLLLLLRPSAENDRIIIVRRESRTFIMVETTPNCVERNNNDTDVREISYCLAGETGLETVLFGQARGACRPRKTALLLLCSLVSTVLFPNGRHWEECIKNQRRKTNSTTFVSKKIHLKNVFIQSYFQYPLFSIFRIFAI